MRYGTVPVVRAVGGLKDTVFDWDYSTLPLAQRNGFVFESPDQAGFDSALDRALGLWHNEPEMFRQLAVRGMCYDYSWKHPGEHYLRIFEFIAHK